MGIVGKIKNVFKSKNTDDYDTYHDLTEPEYDDYEEDNHTFKGKRTHWSDYNERADKKSMMVSKLKGVYNKAKDTAHVVAEKSDDMVREFEGDRHLKAGADEADVEELKGLREKNGWLRKNPNILRVQRKMNMDERAARIEEKKAALEEKKIDKAMKDLDRTIDTARSGKSQPEKVKVVYGTNPAANIIKEPSKTLWKPTVNMAGFKGLAEGSLVGKVTGPSGGQKPSISTDHLTGMLVKPTTIKGVKKSHFSTSNLSSMLVKRGNVKGVSAGVGAGININNISKLSGVHGAKPKSMIKPIGNVKISKEHLNKYNAKNNNIGSNLSKFMYKKSR